jgi:hypothetical protein
MREELTTQGLEMRRTSHARIWSARQRETGHVALAHAVRQLRRGCVAGDAAAALGAIRMAVDDFEPSQTATAAARRVSVTMAAPPVGATSLLGMLVAR